MMWRSVSFLSLPHFQYFPTDYFDQSLCYQRRTGNDQYLFHSSLFTPTLLNNTHPHIYKRIQSIILPLIIQMGLQIRGYNNFKRMEKTQAQKDRALLRAEKQGYDVETYKKVEHTNAGHLDNKKVAQLLGGDEDNIKVAVMSHDLKIAIQQARQEKGMNQEQLAFAISEQKSNVKDYENGKLVPSGNTIVKMEKALGVKLPRPTKKKIGEM